jgi:hypothetical protein
VPSAAAIATAKKHQLQQLSKHQRQQKQQHQNEDDSSSAGDFGGSDDGV